MSADPVSAEEIAHRRFSSAFRGFDPGEVREYLDRVAAELRASTKRERELQRRLADAEHRAAHPVIDEDVLTQSLGEETARILASAHDVARELKSKAEENAARILREAHADAQRITGSAEVVLAERTEEAEQVAEEIRRAARSEMESVLAKARQDARAVTAAAEAEANRTVKEAETTSARVVKELARRRRIAHAQVEQLLAGRERLLEAYRVVHRTLEEVGEELQRAEPEAREASEAVARRTGIESGDAEDAGGADLAPNSESRLSVSVGARTAVSAAASQPDEPDPGPTPRSDPTVDVPAEPRVEPASPHGAVSIDAPAAHAIVKTETETEAERHGDAGAQAESAVHAGSQPVSVPEPQPVPEPEREYVAEPESSVQPDRVPGTGPDPLADSPSGVAELFARIKAGRRAAVAQAEQVLNGHAEGRQSTAASSPGRSGEGVGEGESATADEATDEAGEDVAADGDDAALNRRDAVLESITSRLGRKLKRALQDEQNEVLDRLRSSKGAPSDELLPSSAEQAEHYRRTSVDLLEEAAAAGARFMVPEASLAPEVGDLADGLAEALGAPLRRRLQRCLAGEDGEDSAATAEHISAAYREWKIQLVDRLAGDATISAFSRGVAQAATGALLRWVVDDDGGPCPDCYDNALAGATPSGDSYPTGQVHPPAHAGCRCLLVPANT